MSYLSFNASLFSERRLSCSDCGSNISSGVDDVESEEQSSERTLLDFIRDVLPFLLSFISLQIIVVLTLLL